MLAVAEMSDYSPMPTAQSLHLDRVLSQYVPFFNPTYIRSLAGKLQYLTMTRPDLQFAVNYVCQKIHDPISSNYNLLKRILIYVKGTLQFWIFFL